MNRLLFLVGPALAAAVLATIVAIPTPDSTSAAEITHGPNDTSASSPGAQVGGGTISVGSTTVAPGAQVTVDITATPDPGATIGALDGLVNYDSAVVAAIGCTPVTCNPASDPDTVAFSLADLSGLSGVEVTITFQAIGADGAFSNLDLVIFTCADTQGNTIPCTDIDGVITIVSATPTPTPPVTPTPAPTLTPFPTPTFPPPTITPVPTPTIPPTIPFPFVFSPKFLCGTAGAGDSSVKPGSYATAVNIHNSGNRDVQLGKQAVLAFGEDEPRGARSDFTNLTLAPDDALRIDCPDIRALLDLPADEAFIEGFVVIGVLPAPGADFFPQMDVFAVYTTQFVTNHIECLKKDGAVIPLPADGKCPKDTAGIGVGTGVGTDTDVERIEPTFTGFFPPPVSPPQSPPQSPPIGAALDAMTSTPGAIGGGLLTGVLLTGMGIGFLRVLRSNGGRDDLDL